MSETPRDPQKPSVPTLGLVLAGGEGKRMGGDKPFREIAGKPLIELAVMRAERQCDQVMISSNDDAGAFAKFGVPVIGDLPEAGQGPLGGVLGGLNALPDGIDWLVTYPVDCPVVPGRMAVELIEAALKKGAKAAYVNHAGRDHYLSSAWHRDAAPVIAKLLADGKRRVRGPLDALNAAELFYDERSDQPGLFANANTVDELASINAIISAQRASDA